MTLATPHTWAFENGTENGIRVFLYLEDDDATAYIFQIALQAAAVKLRLFRASDGEQALSFLLREGIYSKAPTPVIVILDLNVPKKSGFDVLAAMQGHDQLKTIPAVVLEFIDLAR